MLSLLLSQHQGCGEAGDNMDIDTVERAWEIVIAFQGEHGEHVQ